MSLNNFGNHAEVTSVEKKSFLYLTYNPIITLITALIVKNPSCV
jgi:hypothetical protein